VNVSDNEVVAVLANTPLYARVSVRNTGEAKWLGYQSSGGGNGTVRLGGNENSGMGFRIDLSKDVSWQETYDSGIFQYSAGINQPANVTFQMVSEWVAWFGEKVDLQLVTTQTTTTLPPVTTTTTITTTTIPPQSNPVAYWRLDESSGTTASDSSGLGNTGTLNNGPQWTIGKVNNGLYFDGFDDYVSVSKSSSLDIARDITIAAWVKPFNVNRRWGTIFDAYSNTWHTSYGLRLNGGSDSSNLRGYWKFDEYSGSTARDSSIFLNHGSVNGPTRVSGRYGTALSFDGIDDYVEVNENAPSWFDIPGSITITAWIKANPNVSDYRTIIARQNGTKWPYRLILWKDTGEIHFDFSYNGGWPNMMTLTGPKLNDNQWHHIAAVRDSQSRTVKLYVDNLLINSSTYSGNVDSLPTTKTWIGRDPHAGGSDSMPYWGYVDEVQIWNRVLTQEEINTIYNSREIQWPAQPFSFDLAPGSNEINVSSSTIPQNGVWYHVAGTYDGSTARLYVNGIQENAVSASGNLVLPTWVEIGSVNTPTGRYNYFEGVLDEVKVWNRALSASEIRGLVSTTTTTRTSSTTTTQVTTTVATTTTAYTTTTYKTTTTTSTTTTTTSTTNTSPTTSSSTTTPTTSSTTSPSTTTTLPQCISTPATALTMGINKVTFQTPHDYASNMDCYSEVYSCPPEIQRKST